jgi:hypothetical protein
VRLTGIVVQIIQYGQQEGFRLAGSGWSREDHAGTIAIIREPCSPDNLLLMCIQMSILGKHSAFLDARQEFRIENTFLAQVDQCL